MSEALTRRTDAEAWMAGDQWEEKDEVVDADFCRGLERELSAVTAERDSLRRYIERFTTCSHEAGYDCPRCKALARFGEG